MNKLLSCLLLFSATIGTLVAQQHRYAWKIGLHAGLSNYYGDLSHQIWDLPQQFQQPINDLNFLTYGISVEYHASKTFGLRLLGTKGQFKASDRSYSNSQNYNRALNVQTDLIDASLIGIVYFDDGIVFNSRSIVSPYFMFGGGLSYFETKGDLLSADNNRYYYWSDRTIRTQAENAPNANMAQIITQDYQYETDLRALQTEGKHYDPITWNLALGLGVKFRLSQRFHLHLEALIRYTGTDFLDDISDDYLATYNDNFQAYAANPSATNRTQRGDSPTMNDWYSSIGFSIHYSFGQKTYAIRPAIIYTESLLAVDSMVVNTNIQRTDTTTATTGTTSKTTTIINDKDNSVPLMEPLETPIQAMIDTFDSIDTSSKIPPTVTNATISQSTVDTIIMDSITTTSPIHTIDSMLGNDSSKVVLWDSISSIPDSLTTSPNSSVNQPYSKTIHQLELNSQQQKYEYELKLQQQKYEGMLREQKLLHELEKEKQRTNPNAQEQALKLELQKQQYENQLKEQSLLNQLEKGKNRPTPSTLENDLKIQQQAFDAKLKLQQQDYEYRLKLQQLQNALNLERLKNGDTLGYLQNLPPLEHTTIIQSKLTDSINTPVNNEQINQLLGAIDQQQKQIDLLIQAQNSRPDIEIPTSNTASLDNINTMQAEQNRLRLQIKELELALAAQPSTTKTIRDTVQIMQRDSIYVDKGNPTELTNQLNRQQQFNKDLVQKLTSANQKSKTQQQVIDSLQQIISKIASEKQVVSGELEAFLTQKQSTYITKIYFAVGKSNLTVQAKETLTTLVHHLEKYPNVRFWIKGFASKTGKTAINERLSAERALEVASFLKQSNIQTERIKTTPLGEKNSQSDNELDRRAEIHLSF